MPFKIAEIGVGTAFAEGSEAVRFCQRMGDAWREVRFVLRSTEAAPLDGLKPGRTSTFLMLKGEELSDAMMRFMHERQGEQPWAGSVPVEIQIGKNVKDRFPVTILHGANGWFDVEMTDRSYVSIRPPSSDPPAELPPRPKGDG